VPKGKLEGRVPHFLVLTFLNTFGCGASFAPGSLVREVSSRASPAERDEGLVYFEAEGARQ
jgi:hypothetical protein